MSHLHDLKLLLRWEGEIDNERIRRLLGVKTVWASRLLGELIKAAPPLLERKSAHAPLRHGGPIDERDSPDEYLHMLTHHANESLSSDIGPVEDIRLDLGQVPIKLFSTLHAAAKRGTGVRIHYRSMANPNGLERLIFPHSLIRAPRRWHVRAWCELRQEFRDFTLGRISEAVPDDSVSSQPSTSDLAWNQTVEIVIVPHPALTPAQQQMIAAEYFPGAKAKRIRLRQCLAAYTIQDLRLAVNPEVEQPPEFQLMIANTSQLPPLFIDR